MASRTVLGPLTTPFVYPSSCGVVVKNCYTCVQGYQAQTCSDNTNNPQGIQDNLNCWPPRATTTSISTGVAVNGWGIYSPGLECPVGYSTACVATGGVDGGFPFQFQPVEGETMAGCCPTGYSCQYQAGVDAAQTCYKVISTGSFATVQCSDGTSNDYSFLAMPATLTVSASETAATTVLTRVNALAPLIQLARRSSDGSATSTSTSSSTPSRQPGSESEGGLGTGAKAGIGVGVGVAGLLAIGALLWFLLWRRRRRPATDAAAVPLEPPTPGFDDGKGGGVGHSPYYNYYGSPSELGPGDPRVEAPVGPFPSGDVAEMGGNYASELPAGTPGPGEHGGPRADGGAAWQ